MRAALGASRSETYNRTVRPPCSGPENFSMSLDWSPFVDVVRRCQRFVLTTHVRPDPDALGSSLALTEATRRHGQKRPRGDFQCVAAALRFLGPDTASRLLREARGRIPRRRCRHRAGYGRLGPTRRFWRIDENASFTKRLSITTSRKTISAAFASSIRRPKRPDGLCTKQSSSSDGL